MIKKSDKNVVYRFIDPDREVYLQVVGRAQGDGDLVRVVVNDIEAKASLEKIVQIKEKFCVFFPVNIYARRGILERLGAVSLPNDYIFPTHMRSLVFLPDGVALYARYEMSTREIQYSRRPFSAHELTYSPYGIPNDTLLLEWCEDDWELEKYGVIEEGQNG